MTRQDMINILSKARPDVPKTFWSGWADDDIRLQVELVKNWMKQHAYEAAFA